MKVAGVQKDVAFADIEANLTSMESWLEKAAERDADLVVFPECALCGYCFESFEEAAKSAEEIPGPSSRTMAAVCGRFGLHAAFGMMEKDGDRLFNACVLVGPEGVVGSYRKVHLPKLGGDLLATPGDRPFEIFQVGEARVGMHICYDCIFPEAPRSLALLGADLIVLPTNWPPGTESMAACIPNARALENNVYYMAINRIGTERGFHFIGHSKICDTDGSVLAEAPHDKEALLEAEIDLNRARQKRIVRVPGKHEIHRFADRRPEMYGPVGDSRLVPEWK